MTFHQTPNFMSTKCITKVYMYSFSHYISVHTWHSWQTRRILWNLVTNMWWGKGTLNLPLHVPCTLGSSPFWCASLCFFYCKILCNVAKCFPISPSPPPPWESRLLLSLLPLPVAFLPSFTTGLPLLSLSPPLAYILDIGDKSLGPMHFLHVASPNFS